MKLSYNWLKQYVDIEASPEKLSEILTDTGLEVEGMETFQSVRGGLKGVVTGEVLTCEKHPNADKLSVTTVRVSEGKVLPIVCGAPNVAKGQKVLVAMVGTTLYSGDDSFEIKQAKIRGEVSEGMICAEDELGLGSSHEGIMVLPDSVEPGTPASEYFSIEEDVVYEIGLTPNRSDAASHIGSARDLVAAFNCMNNNRDHKLKLPSVANFKVDNNDLDIDVIVEDQQACPRYSGLTISGIKVGESPDWLKNRLNAIGLRPINNVVDITNYVLHETGHPLHAFDADKIEGKKVVVKKLGTGTRFVTLDEVDRKLDSNDLMICNTKEGMCIAGVFGGMHSGVTDNTVNVFLESAYFDPSHIRKTSRRHGLQTDASFRFERGADPNITVYVLKRAALLIREIAGGKVSSEIKDVYPEKIEDHLVEIKFENVYRLIGKQIDQKIIRNILTDLGISVEEEDESVMKLRVPSFKVDVTREADIVEEILRIYGYNNVDFSNKLSTSVSHKVKPDLEKLQNSVADMLVAKGFVETMNNSLTKSAYYNEDKVFRAEHCVKLLNPLSNDLDVMRQTLLFGQLEVVAYNMNRRISDQKIFEFGNVYSMSSNQEKEGVKKYSEEKHLAISVTGMETDESWNSNAKAVDFFFLKGIAFNIFAKLGINTSAFTTEEIRTEHFEQGLNLFRNNKCIASVGKINKALLKKFDLKNEVFYADINWSLVIKALPIHDHQYEPVAKFPAVRRDLALVVDKRVRFGDLERSAKKAGRKLLKSVNIFDVYEGDTIPEDKKSYALSFILQDNEKTLTDKVIDKTINKIRREFENEFKAELR